MRCPVCKSADLEGYFLEPELACLRCPVCGGDWIRGAEYWRWLERHGPNLPERPDSGGGEPPHDSGQYLDCPECRFRMVKYAVGHGAGFTLDHCDGCKGIWLDANEWEALRRRNLHDDLHSMLTAFWQAGAVRKERRRHMEQVYLRRFGEADYAELKRVRAWLDRSGRRGELLAYLTDEDPLAV